MALGELRDFAATLFGMIPGFVYTACPSRRRAGGATSCPATSCSRTTACDLWRAAAVIGPGHETVWTRANR
jgi:hypothetical protein